MPVHQPQNNANAGHENENSLPDKIFDDQPAKNGRNGRRHPKKDGDLAHHALGLGQRKHIPHNRARHHRARTGREALQGAKRNQLPHVLRQRAADRCHDEHPQPAQNHGAAAKAVRQGAVKQIHEGKPQQIGRQRELHLRGRCPQRLGNGVKRGNIGVD